MWCFSPRNEANAAKAAIINLKCAFLCCRSLTELLKTSMGACETRESRYPVPAAEARRPHCSQLMERGSRFLAQSCHCPDAAAARDFIAEIRRKNPDATHNCWAFAAGPPGDTARIGFSDDGEPHGTAGRPMLKTLLHSGIGEICMVVSRWFGGVKLGTGGLVRAYQQSAKENMETLPLAERVRLEKLRLCLDYAAVDAVKRLLEKFGANLVEETYAQKASFMVSVPEDRLAGFIGAARDAGRGRIDIEQTPDGD